MSRIYSNKYPQEKKLDFFIRMAQFTVCDMALHSPIRVLFFSATNKLVPTIYLHGSRKFGAKASSKNS